MTQAIRKSTTTPELYFQIRVPHTGKGGKEYTNATVFARAGGKGFWDVSIVRCSKGDQFNRKVGRTMAKRAMQAGKFQIHQGTPTYEDALAFYQSI